MRKGIQEGKKKEFRYAIYVRRNKDGRGFIATVNGLPDLVAFGNTSEEAVKEANIAIQDYKGVCTL